MPHALNRSDVHLAQLADELGVRLSREVTLSARAPGQIDDEGNELPGVLHVRDPQTGDELDVDDATVQEVIAAHVPPPPVTEERTGALDRARAAAEKLPAGSAKDAILALIEAMETV